MFKMARQAGRREQKTNTRPKTNQLENSTVKSSSQSSSYQGVASATIWSMNAARLSLSCIDLFVSSVETFNS